MEEIAKSLRWSKIAAPVLPPGRAFLNNEKLGQLVDRVISGKTFSQLNIPFAVVAADTCTGEEVVIREGRVADAVRASTAIPAIFEPVKLGDRVLMDGAVLNMVPASVCRSMGADIVVAVSVSDFHFQPGSPRNMIMAILRYTDMMLKRQVALSQNQWADIVISVERPDLSGYNFREARQFIREGERAANSVIPRIKSLISSWRC
jgi:NTE family protein